MEAKGEEATEAEAKEEEVKEAEAEAPAEAEAEGAAKAPPADRPRRAEPLRDRTLRALPRRGPPATPQLAPRRPLGKRLRLLHSRPQQQLSKSSRLRQGK